MSMFKRLLSSRSSIALSCGVAFATSLFLAGCEQPAEITEYSAPRGDTGRPFFCGAPKGWKLAPNDRFSELAFTSSTGVSVTVSSLAGTGDEFLLMNVNRWRGQVGLKPVESLEGLGTAELKNGEAKLMEVVGETTAITGAIVENDGKTWFFKMKASAAAVADQADEFSEFLKSVEFFEKSGS